MNSKFQSTAARGKIIIYYKHICKIIKQASPLVNEKKNVYKSSEKQQKETETKMEANQTRKVTGIEETHFVHSQTQRVADRSMDWNSMMRTQLSSLY